MTKPPAPDLSTVLSRLEHVLDMFKDTRDDRWMVEATSNHFLDAERTGLTLGDLRDLFNLLSPPDVVPAPVGKPVPLQQHDNGPDMGGFWVNWRVESRYGAVGEWELFNTRSHKQHAEDDISVWPDKYPGVTFRIVECTNKVIANRKAEAH